MPRGDGTGPLGAGPRSGRAAGFCARSEAPGFATAPGFGRRSGLGRGRGRFGRGGGGFGRGFRAGRPPAGLPFGAVASPEAEGEILEQEARELESSLEQVRRRLGQIAGGKDASSK
jgi:hypothetical protein